MAHIHLYKNNPTANSTDGTELSSGDGTQPLTFALNAGDGESAAQKVAVRCESGYRIDGACEIYFSGSTANKWAVSADNNFSDTTTALTFGDWQERMTIENVEDTNKIFWVRASSSSLESPQNDTSVIMHADGIVVQTGD